MHVVNYKLYCLGMVAFMGHFMAVNAPSLRRRGVVPSLILLTACYPLAYGVSMCSNWHARPEQRKILATQVVLAALLLVWGSSTIQTHHRRHLRMNSVEQAAHLEENEALPWDHRMSHRIMYP